MRATRASVTIAPARALGTRTPYPAPIGAVGAAGPGSERRLSDSNVGARVLRRLDAATAHPSDHTLAALRLAVTNLVDHLKALELSLERVVAAVAGLLREHGVPGRGPALHADDVPPPLRDASAIHAWIVDWTIGAYRDDAWW